MKFEGGAQLTDKGYIEEGIRRRHNIYVLTPENSSKLLVHEQDFFVISNCRVFDRRLILSLREKKVKYAFFHHDTYCAYRLFFPWTEKCLTRCPEFAYWNSVFGGAQLNIFMSPLHHKMHSEAFGNSIEPHIETPSAIDVASFFDKGQPREDTFVSINTLLPYKGMDEILEYARDHPDQHFDFGGDNQAGDLPENCTHKGLILYGKLNDFLNKYKHYIELPRNPQPFNRTVAEAYLAGCDITGNKLLGALTWPWFTSRDLVRQKLSEAPVKFWEELEAII